MEIRRYTPADEALLLEMLAGEGDAWGDYHRPENRERFRRAFSSSVVYVACSGGRLQGYVRCREDDGYGVYVFDLLVQKEDRGRRIGKSLMERVRKDFPGQPVYVMSDVDPYYEKLGYEKTGSIFKVTLD